MYNKRKGYTGGNIESLEELNAYLREKCIGYQKTIIPGKPMSAISAANYEEFLLKFELTVGKEKSVNALCKRAEQNNISVNSPRLEQYDNLLRREVI